MKPLHLSLITAALLVTACKHNISTKQESATRPVAHAPETAIQQQQADSMQKPQDPEDDEAYNNINNYKVSSADGSAMLTISGKAILLVDPDDAQIERLKKTNSEDDLSTIADDNNYYQYTADEYLKKQPVQLIHPQKRYVRLIGSHQTYLLDLHPKVSPGWLAIFFQPDSVPRIVDVTDTAAAYQAYFGNPAAVSPSN